MIDSDIQIVDSDHPGWDQYVRNHPKGTVFHTQGMVRVFAGTKGIRAYASAAVDAEGHILALLVSCAVSSVQSFGAFTTRAVQFSEPICDDTDQGVRALTELVREHDRYMQKRSLFCEVRSIGKSGPERDALEANGYVHRDYINYVIDLEPGVDRLWAGLRKKIRQKIRATNRGGVEVRDDVSEEGIGRLYELLRASYRRARMPLPDRTLFEGAVRILPPECVRLQTAFLHGKPAASVISLAFGDRVFSWYGGTTRIPGLSPFACIVWEDIRWSAERGFRYYDFGGAGWPHQDYGPRRFKARFGGDEVRYGRYGLTYAPRRLKIAEAGFSLSRRLGVWS